MDPGTTKTASTIGGFCYLTGIVFLTLNIQGQEDLSGLVAPKDLLPYLTVVVVAVSYIVGSAVSSMIPVFGSKIAGWLESKGVAGIRVASREPGANQREVMIWAHGSAQLVREINGRIRHLLLVRLLLPGIPFLTLSASAWLLRFQGADGAVPVAIVGLTLSIGLACGYQYQVKQVRRLEEMACDEIKRSLSGS